VLALVTCRAARDLDTDLPLLGCELPEAAVVAWDDPTVDWGSFSAAIIRSTWDYHRRRDEFLGWARGVSAVTTLWNPIEVIEWNTDKRYLAELGRHGVPIVPTVFLDDRDRIDRSVADGAFDGDVIVKPTVGASASGVLLTRDDPVAAERHARALLDGGFVPMLQPYLSSVERGGETGLVYLGGEFSHAFRRRVVLPSADADDDLLGNERSEARDATPAERLVGEAVMERLPPTAYARIDLLDTPTGPVLLELELTEPSLFLHLDDGAPARAAAVFRNLAG
jgi:glutathione synthase/RimK-type ligase-like ATP-grasp enzyme